MWCSESAAERRATNAHTTARATALETSRAAAVSGSPWPSHRSTLRGGERAAPVLRTSPSGNARGLGPASPASCSPVPSGPTVARSHDPCSSAPHGPADSDSDATPSASAVCRSPMAAGKNPVGDERPGSATRGGTARQQTKAPGESVSARSLRGNPAHVARDLLGAVRRQPTIDSPTAGKTTAGNDEPSSGAVTSLRRFGHERW